MLFTRAACWWNSRQLVPRSARMGASLSRALAAVRGQERRRPVQMAVGVMNAKFRRAFERRTIMSTWGSMLPESRLAVRFVQRCRSCNQTKQRSCVKVVCVDEETEHQKAIAWFRLALDLFPRAQWICHSDDDVFLQARQVHRQAGSPNLKCCVPKRRVRPAPPDLLAPGRCTPSCHRSHHGVKPTGW